MLYLQYKNKCKNKVFQFCIEYCKIVVWGVVIMFSVKKPQYINKTFRMPVELVQKLESLAQEKQVSLNSLIVQCCDYALENVQPSESDFKS